MTTFSYAAPPALGTSAVQHRIETNSIRVGKAVDRSAFRQAMRRPHAGCCDRATYVLRAGSGLFELQSIQKTTGRHPMAVELCFPLSLSLFGLTLRSLADGGREPATRDTARHSQRESEQIN